MDSTAEGQAALAAWRGRVDDAYLEELGARMDAKAEEVGWLNGWMDDRICVWMCGWGGSRAAPPTSMLSPPNDQRKHPTLPH